MKISIFTSLKEKYKILSEDGSQKGYTRILREWTVEYFIRKKFTKLGVAHPNNCAAISDTNSKSENNDSRENQPTNFYSISKAFKHLPVPPKDICLLDIGCGSGRILSYGMLKYFKRVDGVDLDEAAIKKAGENCRALWKQGYRSDFDVAVKDATNYKIHDSINVIYLFNPFGEKTMKAVLDNIMLHCTKLNKQLYIVYVNPVHIELFEKTEGSKKVFESYYKNKVRDIVIFSIKPGERKTSQTDIKPAQFQVSP